MGHRPGVVGISTLKGMSDAVVLSNAEFERIRGNSQPPGEDRSVQDAKARAAARHERTLQATSCWANSIANERQARITRLAKEAEARELAQQEVDRQEANLREEKRKALLTRAADIRFQQKPEVRAVNSQLVLHEVMKERAGQLALQTRRRERERAAEAAYAESERERLAAALEAEEAARARRRAAAIVEAEGFRVQREETIARKAAAREVDKRDQAAVAEETMRFESEDAAAAAKVRQRAAQMAEDQRRGNEALTALKRRGQELEDIEAQRIRDQKIALDEELEARARAEAERRATRQAAVDRLIERGAAHLATLKAADDQFDAAQFEEQQEKEYKRIREDEAKAVRLRQERIAYERVALAEAEARKRAVPPAEPVLEEDDSGLDARRLAARRELAAFQKRQAAEKHERDAAAHDRERLEFQRQLDIDAQKLAETQVYAREMLLASRARRGRKTA